MSDSAQNKIRVNSKEQLYELIDDAIRQHGYNCSLNHLDVSSITDMSGLFRIQSLTEISVS